MFRIIHVGKKFIWAKDIIFKPSISDRSVFSLFTVCLLHMILIGKFFKTRIEESTTEMSWLCDVHIDKLSDRLSCGGTTILKKSTCLAGSKVASFERAIWKNSVYSFSVPEGQILASSNVILVFIVQSFLNTIFLNKFKTY